MYACVYTHICTYVRAFLHMHLPASLLALSLSLFLFLSLPPSLPYPCRFLREPLDPPSCGHISTVRHGCYTQIEAPNIGP